MIAHQPEQQLFRFAEFFAGIGLVRMGLERASSSFRCVFANDLDPMKRAMYAHHFESSDHDVNDSDVHELDSDLIGNVDLATASFPCTDLSLAGGRAGVHNGESSAFWGFYRVLSELEPHRPSVVLLENVVGLLSSNKGQDFEDVLKAMNELGYNVDPVILDARWFVPQSRQRLFVVCIHRDHMDSTAALPRDATRLRPEKLVRFMQSRMNEIQWGLLDYPDPPNASDLSLDDIVCDPPREHSDWWSRERVDYLLNQMFSRHLDWVEEKQNGRKYSYATAFRRVRPIGDGSKRSMAELRTDGIAGCLRTPKGGSGRQILVRSGRGSVDARLLSPHECAALMGAAEFKVSGTSNQALFGFGDAVCVDAVTWLAENAILPVLTKAHTSLCV